MNKGLIALALISLMILVIAGCKVAPPSTPSTTGQSSTEAHVPGTPAAEAPAPNLTGDINDVDTTSSELNSSDLQNTDSLINEVTW